MARNFGAESGKVRAWNLPKVFTVPKFYLPYSIPISPLLQPKPILLLPKSTLSILVFRPTLFSYLHLLELDPLDGERKGLFGRGELPGICLAADRVTLGARDVVSVPLSADLMLPETFGVSCVSVPTLTSVGEDIGSRKLGPYSGTLRGVFTMVSSCLRKEGRIKDTRVDKEMGSGVGPGVGVGNSLIRSAICSSGPVCTTSIRAGGVGISMSRDALASSSNSLTTSPTMDSTNTSLTGTEVPARHVLGECGDSGLAGVSSSRLGSEGPG